MMQTLKKDTSRTASVTMEESIEIGVDLFIYLLFVKEIFVFQTDCDIKFSKDWKKIVELDYSGPLVGHVI